MPAQYVIETTGDISLSAATAKTILSWLNAANALFRITEIEISFDGVSATAEPVTVELMSSTEATAGTSTAHTIVQRGGPTRTAQGTAKRNFTAEPTALTCVGRWLVHPQTGRGEKLPLGREVEQITTADAMVIRCTAPATVNAQAHMVVEEG